MGTYDQKRKPVPPWQSLLPPALQPPAPAASVGPLLGTGSAAANTGPAALLYGHLFDPVAQGAVPLATAAPVVGPVLGPPATAAPVVGPVLGPPAPTVSAPTVVQPGAPTSHTWDSAIPGDSSAKLTLPVGPNGPILPPANDAQTPQSGPQDKSNGSLALSGSTNNGLAGTAIYTPLQPAGGPQIGTIVGAAYQNGTGTLTGGTQATVIQGDASTQKAITTSVSTDGTVATNSQTTHDDGHGNKLTAGLGVTVGPNGPAVNASGGYENDKVGVSGNASINPNEAQAGVQIKYGDVKAGVSVDTKFGQIASDVVDKDKQNPAFPMMGKDFLATSRQDSTSVSASLGAGNLGVGGGVFGGSSLALLAQLPDDWNSQTDPQKEAFKQLQKDQLAQCTGLANYDVKDMAAGTGVQFTTYNGWNANAGVSYGGIGVSGGLDQSSAHQVSIVKDKNGNLVVDMVRQDALGTQSGLNALGAGIDMNDKTGTTHEFRFTIDPTKPNQLKEMELFMKTGLLPGADNLKGPDQQTAATKFSQSVDKVDQLNGQLAKLKQTPAAQLTPDQLAQMTSLQTDLGTAQRAVDQNRNYLNDQWQAQATVGGPSPGGVDLTQKADTTTQSSGMSINLPVVGKFSAFQSDQTWVNQQSKNAQGGATSLFAYDQTNYVFNGMTDQHSTQTTSNKDGVVFAMYSDNRIWDSYTGDGVSSILHTDLPDYVLKSSGQDIRGRTTVALTQQQLDGMAAYMNNTKDPKSPVSAMWQDFGSRTSALVGGNEYWLKDPDRSDMSSYMHTRDTFHSALTDPNSPTGQLFAKLPGAKGNPDAEIKALSAKFAGVHGPDDFKNTLSPEEQQLFIQALGKTSGPEGDLTGHRNSFEAMAAIALVPDANLRAQNLRDMYVEANAQAEVSKKDPVWQFAKFTDRFKDDPATFNLIQQGMKFHWQQDDIDQLVKDNTADQLTGQMKEAFNSQTLYIGQGNIHDPNKEKALQVLQAANQQGGAAEMDKVIRSSGTDPVDILNHFDGDPVKQHMFYDLMMNTSYAAQLQALKFEFEEPPS